MGAECRGKTVLSIEGRKGDRVGCSRPSIALKPRGLGNRPRLLVPVPLRGRLLPLAPPAQLMAPLASRPASRSSRQLTEAGYPHLLWVPVQLPAATQTDASRRRAGGKPCGPCDHGRLGSGLKVPTPCPSRGAALLPALPCPE